VTRVGEKEWEGGTTCVSNRNTPYYNRDRGRWCSPLTSDDELVEKKRASARCKNGRGGEEEGRGELITRRNGANWGGVTLAFPRAPPLLPPARAQPKISGASARACSAREWLWRNRGFGRSWGCRRGGGGCITGTML
jgi:hypothetical protein